MPDGATVEEGDMAHVPLPRFSDALGLWDSFMVPPSLCCFVVPILVTAGSIKAPPITVDVEEMAETVDKATSCLLWCATGRPTRLFSIADGTNTALAVIPLDATGW